MNVIFYFIIDGNVYNCADDDLVTVNDKELTTLEDILQNEARLMIGWFKINAMQAKRISFKASQIARLMKPTWGPPGADRKTE